VNLGVVGKNIEEGGYVSPLYSESLAGETSLCDYWMKRCAFLFWLVHLQKMVWELEPYTIQQQNYFKGLWYP